MNKCRSTNEAMFSFPVSGSFPHNFCPDLIPVMTMIRVDPEIATTATHLRTSLHYVHVHVRKVVCDNTVLSGVCYILCCMNMLYICRFPITIRFQVLQFINTSLHNTSITRIIKSSLTKIKSNTTHRNISVQ